MSEFLSRALLEEAERHGGESVFSAMMQRLLLMQRPTISVEEWEDELKQQTISKEDLNNLVMDFLVSEECKEAAESFQEEASITSRLSSPS
jgi:hypothetical protein